MHVATSSQLATRGFSAVGPGMAEILALFTACADSLCLHLDSDMADGSSLHASMVQ